eukprot:364673-Chlamydomonas_euryale.AAC.10
MTKSRLRGQEAMGEGTRVEEQPRRGQRMGGGGSCGGGCRAGGHMLPSGRSHILPRNRSLQR